MLNKIRKADEGFIFVQIKTDYMLIDRIMPHRP